MRIARLNWVLLACAGLLCATGLLMLWTFSPPDWDDPKVARNVFVRQAAFLAVGLAVLGVTLIPNYLYARRAAWFLYGACAATLGALLLLARETNGTRGWFDLGPLKVQPAEFAKIATVLALARCLMYVKDLDRWRGLAKPIAVLALPAGLILAQPDFGTAALFVPAFLAMLWAAGARTRHMIAIVIVLAAAVPVAFRFGMKEYQRNRILSFLHPEKVPRELRRQQEQSVKACGAGGAAGRGIQETWGNTAFYIPERHTDFVYSLVAEQFGFVGSTFVLLVFALFLAQALRMAYFSREPFGRLVVVGLSTFLAFQVYVNVGMTLGVAPITGLTLPLVSYGGSSLLTTLISVAIILNVGSRWTPSFSSRDLGGPVEMTAFRPHEELRRVL
ncbi:MAG: rod shape-determining protein RodA [Planctomycetes bacterium]|nr:rod shape-determining protein RodA [Planctomycetota bacterium]